MSFLRDVRNPHPGSWKIGGIALPDFGATEFASDLLGRGRNQQGGSALLRDRAQPIIHDGPPIQIRSENPTVLGIRNDEKSTRNNFVSNRSVATTTNSPNEGQNQGDGGYQNAIDEQTQRLRGAINARGDAYIRYLDEQLGLLPQEQQSYEANINRVYDVGKERIDAERRSRQRDVAEQVAQLGRAGNDQFGIVGAGNSSAAQVMLPYALGREAAKANAKISQVALQEMKALEAERNDKLFQIGESFRQTRNRFQELKMNADGDRLLALQALEENILANLENEARTVLGEYRAKANALGQWATQRLAQLNDYKMSGYNIDPLDQLQKEVAAGEMFYPFAKRRDQEQDAR